MSVSRMGIAFFVLLLGGLQLCESDACQAGNLIVSLIAVAIVVPASAIIKPISSRFVIGSGVLSLVLLVIAAILSPIPTPGLMNIAPIVVLGLFLNSRLTH